jgi:TonB family protein
MACYLTKSGIVTATILLFGHMTLGQRSAPPESKPPVRVGSEFVKPRMLREVQPEYPELARQQHIHGVVIVEVHINRAGRVTEARVVTGHPLLKEAALVAVRQWLYEPFKFAGEPVEAFTTVAISFPPQSKRKSTPHI